MDEDVLVLEDLSQDVYDRIAENLLEEVRNMATGTDTKAELRRLIDELSEADLYALKRFAEYLRAASDPLWRALKNAPPDDEPETEEERQAVTEAWEDVRAGRLIPDEELWQRLGHEPRH